MTTLYWIALLVGGFFVALSLFGGDADTDLDATVDADLDLTSGAGFIDLLSLRTVFLFAAFFGLTGVLFSWQDAGEPFTALVSAAMGLVAGLGGSYVLKRVAGQDVSSTVTTDDLRGKTAQVQLPLEPGAHGTVTVVARGTRMRLVARPFDASEGAFAPGEEVVIVRMDGRVAEVVRPGGALPPAPGAGG